MHNDPKKVKLLEQNKYYFMPTINVDGVAENEKFYNLNGENHLQRKNLQHESSIYSACNEITGFSGVDLNRNFGFQWELAGKNPCDETYRGPAPFSSPESQVLKKFISGIKDELRFMYSFHSSGNFFFLPF